MNEQDIENVIRNAREALNDGHGDEVAEVIVYLYDQLRLANFQVAIAREVKSE